MSAKIESHAEELREQTATQDLVKNNLLYTAAATKKALQLNPFAHHQRSVRV